jgi:cytochrome c oxidase subunit 1
MYKGQISFKAPMLYAMGFIELFTIGGLTGVFLATLAIDVHLTDTYFVIAHFHYVMVGGTIMGFLGGMHYWFPKVTGKMYNEKIAAWAFWLIIIGFNLTFGPQFIAGSEGMPRRYWSQLPEFDLWNRLSTYGSWFLAVGFVTVAYNMIKSAKSGPKAGDNPWRALTMEWQSPSPPPHDNFGEVGPTCTAWPYEYKGANV